jgi:hypothetical protein
MHLDIDQVCLNGRIPTLHSSDDFGHPRVLPIDKDEIHVVGQILSERQASCRNLGQVVIDCTIKTVTLHETVIHPKRNDAERSEKAEEDQCREKSAAAYHLLYTQRHK